MFRSIRAGKLASLITATLMSAQLLGITPAQATVACANVGETALSTFTIEGTAVTDGSTVVVPNGTVDVDVVATPADPTSSVMILGDTDLVTGPNDVTAIVDADSGASCTYTVNVQVSLSNDTSLLDLNVYGVDVTANNQVVNVPRGTDVVDVFATPTDENATVDVTGDSALVGGENDVVITVTAEDGTTQTYTVIVLVEQSNDATLVELNIEGESISLVDANPSINVAAGTDAVDVIAVPTNEFATVDVAGDVDLVSGSNDVTITVTAENGATRVYTVTVVVAQSSDATLSLLTIDEDAVDLTAANPEVNVAAGTDVVDVVALPTDINATVDVAGADALEPGNNTVTVTVTAEDGTVRTYNVTVIVGLSNDASLFELSVDGTDVDFTASNVVVTVDAGTDVVDVVATPTNAGATVDVAGADALESGDNTVTVTVTAEDGTVRDYTFTVRVLESNDVSLLELTVDGEDVNLTTLTIHVPAGTDAVDVVATPTSDTATVLVEGASGLATGSNDVFVTVTAEDGTVHEYTLVVIVDQSTNTGLFVFEIEGDAVADGATVEVPFGTATVDVYCEAEDADATCVATGNTNLKTGNNTITVTVTAADGTTKKTYTATVKVLVSDDATLSSLKLNGSTIAAGGSVTLPKGTTSVTVAATATSSYATVAVTGATGLVSGSNTVTVKVTAQSGKIVNYTITVVVAATNDAWLAVTTAPTVALGAVAAKENTTALTSTIASTTTNFIANGTGWGVNVGVLWLDAKATTLTATKTISVAQGASLNVTATGFAPNNEVRIYLGTVLMATLTSDATGAVTGKVVLPSNQPISAGIPLTLKGFTSTMAVREIAIGSAVKAGFATKVLTVVFKGTATKLDATAVKLLGTIPKLITGAALVKIDIKGWVAAAKASSATTKIATTRATAVKTQLTKIKVKATVTTGYGGLDKSTAKSSKAVVTILYAKK